MSITVCLVAVTMSADSPKLTTFQWDEHTLLAGYDPAWLTPTLVERLLRRNLPGAVEFRQGVLV
jgi:hypothetical protein